MNCRIERFVRALPLIAFATLCGACTQLPKQVGADVLVGPAGGLEEANPNDIAVVPLLVKQAGQAVPAEGLRQAFYHALPRRRYSPLSLDYVDSRVVDAAYRPGSVKEEAILQIVVHDWDASKWDTRRALIVDIEAMLIDTREGANGEVLWSGRVAKRYDVEATQARFSTESLILDEACEAIAQDIVAVIPKRRVEPGRE